MLKVVGDGAYGSVYKALNKNTGEVVAIKKMKKKFTSWEECMSLREIKSLRKLSHPNIVKLKEVIRVNDDLYFVFEFVEQNVYQLSKEKPESMTNENIKSIIYQTLNGLAYMHKNGFFHRDMKPENLLIQNNSLKIADFGLAREIRSKPPYTDYVSTRWYRAPEILLRCTNYNSPVDIFALGAIMAELYLLRPLFPGSNEHDQMVKVCSILGTPTSAQWPDGHRLAAKIGFAFPTFSPVPLQKVIPNAPSDAIDLMTQMMRFDPQKRPTASECLEHPFFFDVGIKSPEKYESHPDSGMKKSRKDFSKLGSISNMPRELSLESPSRKTPIRERPEKDTNSSPYQPFFPKVAAPILPPVKASPFENKRNSENPSFALPKPYNPQGYGLYDNNNNNNSNIIGNSNISSTINNGLSNRNSYIDNSNKGSYANVAGFGNNKTNLYPGNFKMQSVIPSIAKKDPLGFMSESRPPRNAYNPLHVELPPLAGEPQSEYKKPLFPPKKYEFGQPKDTYQNQASMFKPPPYQNPGLNFPLKGFGKPFAQAHLSLPPQRKGLLGQENALSNFMS